MNQYIYPVLSRASAENIQHTFDKVEQHMHLSYTTREREYNVSGSNASLYLSLPTRYASFTVETCKENFERNSISYPITFEDLTLCSTQHLVIHTKDGDHLLPLEDLDPFFIKELLDVYLIKHKNP